MQAPMVILPAGSRSVSSRPCRQLETIVYYDNGQKEMVTIINAVFNSLVDAEIRKVGPQVTTCSRQPTCSARWSSYVTRWSPAVSASQRTSSSGECETSRRTTLSPWSGRGLIRSGNPPALGFSEAGGFMFTGESHPCASSGRIPVR